MNIFIAGDGEVGFYIAEALVNSNHDITIIDPNTEYVIDTTTFRSKSRNCPYNGWLAKSKVINTILGGEIRYSLDTQ